MTDRRLIVSADDFGLTAGVDRGIVAAVAAGSVTSVGVMANLASPPALAALIAARPDVSLGVHLNLTTGRPLSSPAEIASLVDATGTFHSLATLARRALTRRLSTAEIRCELAAQIARARALGVAVDHLDSHEHVHLLPGVTSTVIALARDTGVPRMRTHRPLLLTAPGGGVRAQATYYARHPRRLATHAVKRLVARRLEAAGVAMPDGMVAASLLEPPVAGGPAVEWAAVVSRLPPGTWELVVHPADLGVADRPGEEGRLGELVGRRAAELAALVDPSFGAMVAAHGVALVPFAAVRTHPLWVHFGEERYASRRA